MDNQFANILADLMLNVRGLAEWGLKTENLTRDQLEWEYVKRTPELRKEAAQKLIESGLSQRKAAEVLGVDPATVRTDLGLRDNPSKSEGKSLTPEPAIDEPESPKATIEEKREANERAREAIAASPVVSPDGRYSVIVIDPPWPMEKIERDVRPNQVGFDYPTMSEDELAAFRVPYMAEKDCHLFLWTTHKFLPMGLRLLGAWGFKYVCQFVWHKPGGFQPIGLPQYNCEPVLYARKGSPKFIDTKDFFCCFEAPRREHSRKPDLFYDVVRRVTEGPRIDVFSREPRDGFAQYGNQVEEFGGVDA